MICILIAQYPYNIGMRAKRAVKIITVTAVILCTAAVVAAIVICAVFPNKYARELNDAADEFGLDRSLVRAVVWAESGFDKTAVSDKGALGLMQLMPDTLDECANALYISSPDGFDPTTSLRCGCYYLSLMLDKFDDNVDYALMAYNAGENNARRFMRGEPVFSETEAYVKKIKLAKKIYGAFGF